MGIPPPQYDAALIPLDEPSDPYRNLREAEFL